MKTAVCGVWHVHAGDYTKRAQALDEVVGFWEEDDVLAEQFQSVFPIHRFGSLEELLESDAEGIIVCTATSQHIHVMPKIAAAGKHIGLTTIIVPPIRDKSNLFFRSKRALEVPTIKRYVKGRGGDSAEVCDFWLNKRFNEKRG